MDAECSFSRNAQSEMIDHGFEITVSVKQNVAVHDAESADDQVDRLSYGYTALTDQTKIACGLNDQLRTEH